MPVKSAIPVLLVTDPQRSLGFYTQALGFEADWSWQEPDGMAFHQISQGRVRVYLRQVDSVASPGCLYLYVDDVDKWHQQLLRRSLPVDTLPSAKPWGNREMCLSDPDGNKIHICTPLV
jgi:catechol 2,3-dioxygenase-like lactoylglutathione lyase family enzyme